MGGSATCFQEDAVLAFHEPNRKLMRYYSIELLIADSLPELMHMPPILGRDVLDRWYMHYYPAGGNLEFGVQTADYTARV